ncbi:hypothetical protein HYC85_007846, partial [Camellia sinensis]
PSIRRNKNEEHLDYEEEEEKVPESITTKASFLCIESLRLCKKVGCITMLITDAYKDGVTRKVTLCVRYVTRWPFKPGYTAPPPLLQLGSIPMNFRYFSDSNLVCDSNVFIKENWEISRRDLNNPCFIAMVTTEPNFVDQDYDGYAAFESRSLFCCRSVAAIVINLSFSLSGCVSACQYLKQGNMSPWLLDFDVSILIAFLISCLRFMVLLIVRHTLPILVNGAQDNTFPLFLFFTNYWNYYANIHYGEECECHQMLPMPMGCIAKKVVKKAQRWNRCNLQFLRFSIQMK